MIILTSNERYAEILKLDPETGVAQMGTPEPDEVTGPPNGHFANCPGSFACLYRWNGKLMFRHGAASWEVPSDATATLEEAGKSKVLRVVSANNEIFRWTYSKPATDFIDSLRYTEDEDLDFGVFVHNVINDKGRMDRIYR